MIAWVIARKESTPPRSNRRKEGARPAGLAGWLVAKKSDTEEPVAANPHQQPTIDRGPQPRGPTLRQPIVWGLHPTARPGGNGIGCLASITTTLEAAPQCARTPQLPLGRRNAEAP